MRVIDSFNTAFVNDYAILRDKMRADKSAERAMWGKEECVTVAFDRRTTVALNIKLLLNKNPFIVNPTNIMHTQNTFVCQYHIRIYVKCLSDTLD